MSWFDLVYFAILICYVLGTVCYLSGAFSGQPRLKTSAGWLAGAGFALHTLILIHFLAATDLSSLTSAYSVKLFSWSVIFIFLVLWRRLKMEFLALIASPLATLLFILSFTVRSPVVMPPNLAGPFFGLHIGALFVSMALLAMAFAAGVIFLRLDRKIKRKTKLTGLDKEMPALSVFDRANHWAVVVGFPLYTVGVLSGFVFAKFAWGRILTGDPKEIVSIVVWLLFALLFHKRLTREWWGRRPARWAIGIFTLAIGSMLVVNFLMPSHHSFRDRPDYATAPIGVPSLHTNPTEEACPPPNATQPLQPTRP